MAAAPDRLVVIDEIQKVPAHLLQGGDRVPDEVEDVGRNQNVKHPVAKGRDVYGHLVPGGNRAAVDVLDDAPSEGENPALGSFPPELAGFSG